jgi:hypothetical protein
MNCKDCKNYETCDLPKVRYENECLLFELKEECKCEVKK